MFFEVIPTEVYRTGGGALTYSSELKLRPGHLVLVPLGRRNITGIVLKAVPKVDFPTKPIARLLHPCPIPRHLLKSILWLSDYYLSPLPATANLAIPSGLTARGALQNVSEPTPPQTRKLPLIPLNSAQKTALKSLQEAQSGTRLLRGVTGSGKTNIYLSLTSQTLTESKSVILLVPEIALTSQLVQIFTQTFGDCITLIHSNQTLVERRRAWLRLLESRTPGIVIGPRSALFSPLSNLGLIIIDESHESAYYQENSPRYSALRLASFIAHTLKIPCIQGTATPNIIDYHLAKTHHSLIELSKKAKTTAITPDFTIVDLKDRSSFVKNRYFSDPLLTSITKNLQDHHQTLIFHNRRGSSPLTICEECGWQALCPECYLPMILHADGYLLSCHVCGHEAKVPTTCPQCQHAGIIHKGFGTKLLETELSRLFPEAKIARFDGDNTKKTALSGLYEDVKSGKIDLLIGTQTLARGLDLPHLATVGIVQADSGLSLPDFAAEERAYDLLTQVIGRVGRGHLDRAQVIVQTYQPDHPAIRTALSADYTAFASYLLRKRRSQQLPPFTYLARLAITYKTDKTTLSKIRAAYQTLTKFASTSTSPLIISPPMPAFHERTNRGFTWEIILKSSSRDLLRQALTPFTQFHIELDPPSLL